MAFHRVGSFDAALRRQPRILLPVARCERCLVFRDCLVAIAIKIQHASKVDVRPCQQSRILACRDVFWKSVDSHVGMAGQMATRARMKFARASCATESRVSDCDH